MSLASCADAPCTTHAAKTAALQSDSPIRLPMAVHKPDPITAPARPPVRVPGNGCGRTSRRSRGWPRQTRPGHGLATTRHSS
ncbi:hypothetical protein G6F60_015667 [Rhizopus arrhizus]|nr:hypothetical protein G6F60_015667 [Rhizopus arrhizus]